MSKKFIVKTASTDNIDYVARSLEQLLNENPHFDYVDHSVVTQNKLYRGGHSYSLTMHNYHKIIVIFKTKI